MAERFNLTAQLHLQAPRNTSQVVGDIKRQLSGIEADVKVKGDSRSLAKINSEMQNINKSTTQTGKSVGTLNRNLSEAARRFSVITVATGTMLAFSRSIKDAVGEAIAFEREVIRISQVTGKSVKNLKGLTKEVTRLSTSLGVSAADLLNVSRTLAQAGFDANKTRKALDVLAKTDLGATFDNLQDTTEGAIAVLRQFGNEARAVGGDIKFLEQTMDAINSVSKRFAVESGDLITVIRRTGGVFEAAGGSVNELIALFTSVRATTRESAETISTGLRTIFTRIQRTDTIDQLKALGIQLRDSQGQFVGAFEAVRRLSAGLSSLDPKDYRFSDIVESLGGFRQIGKVIPLIKQFAVAQDALNVAQSASGSVTRDAATAQQALSVQAGKVSEKFGELIRKFADSSTFKSIAKFTLDLAKAFIAVADALTPLLPLLTTMIGLKIGKALAPGIGAVMGVGRRKASGGMVHGFAGGGTVPGTGNRDTVPAMLTPGEFVIRKSSVKKLGVQRLAQMNGYAGGGVVAGADDLKSAFNRKRVLRERTKVRGNVNDPEVQMNAGDSFSANLDTQYLPSRVPKADSKGRAFRNAGKQISDAKFENLAQKRFGGKDGGGGALDLIGGDLPTEVKRTKGNVSDAVLVDKLIRSFAKQGVSNRGGQSTLTGRTNDHLKLRGMRVIYSDQKKNLKPRDAISLGEPLVKARKKAFGGLIQQFAMGGIAKASRIGAAILDPDENRKNETKRIGPDSVKKYIGGSGFDKTRAQKGFGKVFPGKNYTLVRQGLNEKTSKGFKSDLLSGAAQGIGDATAGLSSDLGLGSASFQGDAKSEMQKYLGTTAIGELYEAGVNMLTNKGAFKNTPAGAPVDFPGGLSGAIADNFDKLPSTWVDAKSSYAAASVGGMFNKVSMELADEYERSGEWAKAAKAKAKKAKGGGISGSDTVPALLTPGEFVFNKSSAQSIGYSNLSKMNQRGVQGFNTGGVVGYNRGSRVLEQRDTLGLKPLGSSPSPFAGMGGEMGVKAAVAEINELKAVFEEFGLEGDDLAQAMGTVTDSFREGGSQLDAYDAAIDQLNVTVNERQARGEARLPQAETFAADSALGQGVFDANAQERGGLKSAVQAGPQEDQLAVQNQVAAMQKREIEAIAEKIQAADITTTQDEAVGRAYKVVEQKYGKLATTTEAVKKAQDETNKAQGKYSKALKGAAGRLKGGLGKAKAGAARVGATAKGIQGAAQGAQQFAFFGGAMAAAAVQMGGFSDATKQAITETIGFATGMLGIGGTVIDMMAGLSNMGKGAAAAESAATGAKIKGTAAENTSALAKARGTAAENASSAAKGRGTVAQTANTAALARGTVANNVSATSEGVEAAADTTEGAASLMAAGPLLALIAIVAGVVLVMKYFAAQATAAADALSKERSTLIEGLEQGKGGVSARDRAKATVGEEMAFRGESEGYTTGAYAGAAGAVAVAGSFALAGAAMGSAVPIIGTLVGAIVGATAGYLYATSVSDEETAAREREISAIHGSIDAIHRLGAAAQSFDQAMSDIDLAKGLAPEERVERRLTAQKDLSGEISSSNVDAEFSKLESLAQKAGKSIVSLTEADFDEGSADFHAFNLATKAVTQGQDQLSKATKAARDTLAEAASLELTGEKSWEEVSTGTGLFAQSLRAATAAIEAENATKIKALQAEAASIRKAAGVKLAEASWLSSGVEEQKQYQAELARAGEISKEITKLQEREATQKQDLIDISQAQNEAAGERRKADLLAAAAADEMAAAMRQNAKFLMELNELERSATEKDKNLSNDIARSTGKSMDFSRTGVADLNNIDMVKNVKQFDRDLQGVVKLFPASMQKQAGAMVDTVVATANVFGKGKDDVLKKYKTPVKGEFGDEQQRQLIADAGVDISKLPQKVAEKLLKDIEGSGGAISSEDFDKFFKPVLELGETAAEGLQKIESIRNQEIATYAKYLDHVEEERDKQLSLEKKYRETQAKGMELRARARGQELSMGAKDQLRTRDAQANLRGTGVRAGDVAGALRERKAANQKLKLIQKEIKLSSTTQSQREKLMVLEKEQHRILKQVNGELERLGEQSEKAAEIMEGIESEKAKREALTNIIEEFVVGGPDSRRDMLSAGAGVRMAVATGTLQNQSPEQRGLTIGLLDKLEDIFIGTTGMTGKQVKQELVFRDAIRMGLDPGMAEMLATATSKEQQLIDALDHLTRQMEVVAKEMAKDKDDAVGIATGGLVQYRAGGGSIFKPKGTDTVPAMLTPGEFVVRKSAVDKIGAGNLQSLNNGQPGGVLNKASGGLIANGPVQYRARGGGVGVYSGGGIQSIKRAALTSSFPDWRTFAMFMKRTPGSSENIADVGAGMWSDMLIDWARGTFNSHGMGVGNAGEGLYDAVRPNLISMGKTGNASKYLFKRFSFRPTMGIPTGNDPGKQMKFAAAVADILENRSDDLKNAFGALKGGAQASASYLDSETSGGFGQGRNPAAAKHSGTAEDQGAENFFGTALFHRVMGWSPGLPIQDMFEYAANPYYAAMMTDSANLAVPQKPAGAAVGWFQRAKDIARGKAYPPSVRDSPGPNHYKMGGLVEDKDSVIQRLMQYYQTSPVPQDPDRQLVDAYLKYKAMLKVGNIDKESNQALLAVFMQEVWPSLLATWEVRQKRQQFEGQKITPLPTPTDPDTGLPIQGADRFSLPLDPATAANPNALTPDQQRDRLRAFGPAPEEGTAKTTAQVRDDAAYLAELVRMGHLAPPSELSKFEAERQHNLLSFLAERNDPHFNIPGVAKRLQDLRQEQRKRTNMAHDKSMGLEFRFDPETGEAYRAGDWFAGPGRGLKERSKTLSELNNEELKAVLDLQRREKQQMGDEAAREAQAAAERAASREAAAEVAAQKDAEKRAAEMRAFQERVKVPELTPPPALTMTMPKKDREEAQAPEGMRSGTPHFADPNPAVDHATGMVPEDYVRSGGYDLPREKTELTTGDFIARSRRGGTRPSGPTHAPSLGIVGAGRYKRGHPLYNTSFDPGADRYKNRGRGGNAPAHDPHKLQRIPMDGPDGRVVWTSAIGIYEDSKKNDAGALWIKFRDPSTGKEFTQRYKQLDAASKEYVDKMRGNYKPPEDPRGEFGKPGYGLRRNTTGTSGSNAARGLDPNRLMDSGPSAGYGSNSRNVDHRQRNFAAGGGVSGVDSVPAMLTPGEFVMSPEAVSRHGVGYMKNLNKGRIPGFRRGGLIGGGGVQYKQNGGFLSQAAGAIMNLDPTAVQNVLETFNIDFSGTLEKLMLPFVNVGNQLTAVANAFSSMVMTHNFSGDLSLNVNIANKDAIIEAVKIGIEPSLQGLITNMVNESIKELRDSAG